MYLSADAIFGEAIIQLKVPEPTKFLYYSQTTKYMVQKKANFELPDPSDGCRTWVGLVGAAPPDPSDGCRAWVGLVLQNGCCSARSFRWL